MASATSATHEPCLTLSLNQRILSRISSPWIGGRGPHLIRPASSVNQRNCDRSHFMSVCNRRLSVAGLKGLSIVGLTSGLI